jgi:hypothetical protein
MWRVLVLLLALLCCSVSAPASEVAWVVGFKGGAGFGKLKGDTDLGGMADIDGMTLTITGELDAYRTAFCGGGFVTAMITPSFGIRLEGFFSQKGGRGEFAFTFDAGGETFPGTGEQTYKLDYFELPLLAVGSFVAGNRTRIDLFGGPVLAFKTSANVETALEIDINGETLTQSDEVDIGDDVAGTDFGLALGAGLTILAHPKVHVVIDGRIVHGLTNIPDTEEEFDLKNTTIVLMTGLSFPLGAGAEP